MEAQKKCWSSGFAHFAIGKLTVYVWFCKIPVNSTKSRKHDRISTYYTLAQGHKGSSVWENENLNLTTIKGLKFIVSNSFNPCALSSTTSKLSEICLLVYQQSFSFFYPFLKPLKNFIEIQVHPSLNRLISFHNLKITFNLFNFDYFHG